MRVRERPGIVQDSDDRAILLQCHRVPTARGNCHHLGEAGGDSALAIVIRAPRDDRTVGLQSQCMGASRRNALDAG